MSTTILRNPLYIGFTGAAKAGKDTAADALALHLKSLGYNVLRMSFAEPLKKIGEIFGFTKEQMTDQNLKEVVDDFWGITPRKFMQLVGTEMFRNNLCHDCWVKLLIKRAQMAIEQTPKYTGGSNPTINEALRCRGNEDVLWVPDAIILISDVRFENEAEGIIKEGGFVVRIKRPSLIQSDESWRNHASEKMLAPIFIKDRIINDCSLEEYRSKVIEKFVTIFPPEFWNGVG